ncbi:alginate lyase-domain-containing protein [Glomus cerebriforme]|uniref:Alginate lyase-domain-containing protein n=1 Tax=Glomus cerebriforme TaxID=658196 RepID=A0A397SBQ3_9GLOM|nr:alginate lyase-domain-containing protein [Glomus cerebriforme]
MGLSNQTILTFIIFGTIWFIILWTLFPPENYVKDDPLQLDISTVYDINGNPKDFINGRNYANYLSILRQQHHQMLSNLLNKADKALKNDSIYSVTLKPQLAPSNDPHDYMSLARYFWPDPTQPNGLPYMRRDGYTNPEIETVKDYSFLRKLFEDVENLGFAYYFTRNDSYVEKAVYRIKEWFVNPKTRMNPNLKYASFIKGQEFGRRTGVLDMRPVYRMLQSIPLMRSSYKWDHLAEEQLKNWISKYYKWLETTSLGIEEKEAKNNHGTYYDVQAIYLLSYLGREEAAIKYSRKALIHRVNTGILPTGQQPHETKRPTSWFYSVFNLQALFLLAERSQYYGFDGWNYVGPEGQSIKKAVDYLLPFALSNGKDWPFKNIDEFKINNFIKLLELAFVIWSDNKYLEAITILRPKALRFDNLEDDYICIWSLMTNRQLWTCLK